MLFSIILLIICVNLSNSENLLCSDEFCAAFLENTDCIPLGDACEIHESINSTNSDYKSGEKFHGEVPCGCCEVCMEHIKEGEFCTIGSPDSAPPMMACGPGLYCTTEQVLDNVEYRCRKMDNTPCFKEQILYDKLNATNKIGKFMLRPDCDGDGNYKPVKCNPGQTCFCVANNGLRIFGEEIHDIITPLTMRCECSRLNHKFKSIMDFKNPILTARCMANGNFDTMQCMGEQCACVEPLSGFPNTTNFNMSLTEYSKLPCYNRSFHLDYKYLHDCEAIQAQILDEIHDSEADGFRIIQRMEQECQPDGWFGAISRDATHQFCVDHYNRKIENFNVPVNSDAAKTMNCHCAKSRFLLANGKDIKELPTCCPNGNFQKIQCRSDVCYCVDENGLQIEKEVALKEQSKLKCPQNDQLC